MNIASASFEVLDSVLEMFQALTEKEQDIISKRFGFNNTEIVTLAELGDKYSITRERVRQIQVAAFKKLKKRIVNPVLTNFLAKAETFIEDKGGIITEAEYREYIQVNYHDIADKFNELTFGLELSSKLVHEHNKVDFHPHFRLNSISFADVKKLNADVTKILQEEKKCISIPDLETRLSIKGTEVFLRCFVKLDRRLVVDSLRQVSLLEWRDVNPRTLLDKISFVLNKEMEPLHFRDIAAKIVDQEFDAKKVSVHAVHNELINNPKFVLIGRGIYADKDWGYKEGTVSDVIASILEQKGPMQLYDLTQEVLQRRKVKAVTVQINLNSAKTRFRKTKSGMYELAS
jgi:hypothetical protein